MPSVFVLLFKLVLEVMLNEILGWEKKKFTAISSKREPVLGMIFPATTASFADVLKPRVFWSPALILLKPTGEQALESHRVCKLGDHS